MQGNSSFIIDAQFIAPPEGVMVKNYCFDGEPQFLSEQRVKPLKHFVIHETAGRTASRCKKTLISKKLGVHLILDRDGSVSCHGDLANETMSHANQLNKTSIGIEVINPYAPKYAKGMDIKTIPAEWWTWCPDKEDRRYVLPTDEQLVTLLKIVPFLCKLLKIPYEFPTADLNKKKRKINGWQKEPGKKRAKPKAGIVAHRDFSSHSDGRYILEYLIAHSLSN